MLDFFRKNSSIKSHCPLFNTRKPRGNKMLKIYVALIFQGTDPEDDNKLLMVRYSDSRNMHWLFKAEVPTGMTTPYVFGCMVKMLNLPESHLIRENTIEITEADKWHASALIVKVESLEDLAKSLAPLEGCQYVLVNQHDIGTLPHSKVLVEGLDYELICEARKK